MDYAEYHFGDTVSYRCQSGFNLVGADGLACLSSGRWSGEAPVCEPVKCPTEEIENGVYR